ncbi:MAG: bifunctional acetate--CoA ligase family protein/GNAT family N-acetyltransferase [Bacteroidota bacterium]
MIKRLNKIFRPKNIAIVGASDNPETVGYIVLKNMLDGGFAGQIYPISAQATTVQGKPAYQTVQDLPEKVDLAIITTAAKTVASLVEACGQCGIKGIILVSADFAEMQAVGQVNYEAIRMTAKNYQIRVIGPNCLGVIQPELGINASIANRMPLPGKIALISQSDAICTSILDWSVEQNVGFSHFVSLGSMVDVDFADLIDYFGRDVNTACILIYMESLTRARKFMSAARAFTQHKPIIMLKAGKSKAGAAAATSHTGALAGNDAVFNAAYRRAGIIRVNTIAQLFNMAGSLALQELPKGNRLAIVTNAGGPAVLATDYLMSNGGTMATLTAKSKTALETFLPLHSSRNNPIDILGDATPKRYQKVVEICLQDKNVDGVLVILTPQRTTQPTETAAALVQVAKRSSKTVLASWMGEVSVQAGRNVLEQGNIPHYRYPESAVEVFLKMVEYSNNLRLLYETPLPIAEDFATQKNAAAAMVRRILESGRTHLNEWEGKQLLRYYDIPTTEFYVVQSAEEAAQVTASIGSPVVLKVLSSQISHKTEVGGVVLNVPTPQKAAEAYEQIRQNVATAQPAVKVEGILVEKMINERYELLLGAKKDPIFGPVIVFGRGGVETEVHRDVNIALPPLNQTLAKHLIAGTKVQQLLGGFRGRPAVNRTELEATLVQFANLLVDLPAIAELDVNPFLMDETGGIAVDVHVELTNDFSKTKPFAHLSIPPFPKEYTKQIKLKNGLAVTLRSIQPEDEPLEAAMFDLLSRETIYSRFFHYFAKPDHDELVKFTNIDYDREIAIIAGYTENGQKKMIGVVRLIIDPWNEVGEYSILVADEWQGQGLGSQLTDFVIQIAQERQIKAIRAEVLRTNRTMVEVFKRRGFVELPGEDFSMVEVRLDLSKVTVPSN